jgi:hypothetical protein
MTTREAAKVLGLSERQTRRLATDLGARRLPGGALVYHTAAVEARAHDRREEGTAA